MKVYVLSVLAEDEDEATEYVASLLGTESLPWAIEDEPYCNHDAPAVVNGVCECGARV